MFLMYACCVVLFFVIFVLITKSRFSSKMAALVAWIVSSLTGSKEEQQEEKQQNKNKSGSKPKLKQKINPQQKNEPPKFSTKLKTPVQEAIEETLTEEEIATTKPKRHNKTTKNAAEKAHNSTSPSPQEEQGFIGLSVSPKKNKEKATKRQIQTVTKKQSTESLNSEIFDDIGFSFIPVKDKRKQYKKAAIKIDDIPQTTVTQHYFVQSKKLQNPPFSNKTNNSINPVPENKGQTVVVQIKETKKVEASLSYAKVASRGGSSLDLETQPQSHYLSSEIEDVHVSKTDLISHWLEKEEEVTGIEENQEVQEIYKEVVATNKGIIKQINNYLESSKNSNPETIASKTNDPQTELETVEHNISEKQNIDEPLNCFPGNSEIRESFPDNTDIEVQEISVNKFEKVIEPEAFKDNISEPKKTENPLRLKINVQEKVKTETRVALQNNISEKSDKRELKKPDLVSQNNTSGQPQIEEVCVKTFAYETNQKKRLSTNQFLECERFVESSNQRSEFEVRHEILEKSASRVEVPVKIVDEMAANEQVRVLVLNENEQLDSTLYRIEKNWTIEFRLGPSLMGRKVILHCNYPEVDGKLQEFKRGDYQVLKWWQDEGCKNADDTALKTQIKVKISGSFHYFFTYDESAERKGSGFFLVDPILTYGNNEQLPLDCIQCQTVISKALGSFSTWESKLKVAKESGYNMIHFTPIQELGGSNSAYSISEQLKLNPLFKKEDGTETTYKDVEILVQKIRKEWKVTSICDIVLNHTANESKWLEEHPEVTYNCENCPYLRPAYLLDAALHYFSLEVKKGVYETRGIPPEVSTEDHLNAMRHHFKESVLKPLNIPELFICDVQKLVNEFRVLAQKKAPAAQNIKKDGVEELKLVQDPEYKRLKTFVDMELALRLYNTFRSDSFDEDTRIKKCTEDFKHKLDSLNQAIINEINADLDVAVENVIAGIRYYRVQQDGPKHREISIKTPLVYRYFTEYGSPTNLNEYEEIMYSENGKYLMAHNGWIMNHDPLKNFAAAGTKTYIRRELIAWGDSVKLRYGDKPSDCPFLWKHMRDYVEITAKIFDGVRLDNCHSTPIHVASYLLDCARRVRPDLYVVAELFTNSDNTDNIFVNELGITSLIREAMSAWDSHEQGRLVYRYGGVPVGSFYQPNVRPLVPTVAHALFLDLTHDNPSPVEKRSVFDLLPSSALVNMACCASGSNRGYDELVPHHIHVVDEEREYSEWSENSGSSRYVNNSSGIIAAKKAINDIHFKLGLEGFNQVYVDQMDADIVAVTRHHPVTHESYILVAFTAFNHPNEDSENYQRAIKPLRFEGVLDEIVLEGSLSHVDSTSKFSRANKFVKDDKYINGLPDFKVDVKQHIQINESSVFQLVDSNSNNVTQLNFKNFKPGSVAIVKVSLPKDMQESIQSVRKLIKEFSLSKETELSRIVSKMSLADLNRAIYRCDQEERDEGNGFDTYNIPNFGSMVYAGFQGFMTLLAQIRPNNDLGHPMCCNLRDGNWMIDYIWQRLKLDPGTKELGQWVEENTKSLKAVPRYLIPCYLDVVLTGIYSLLLEHSWNSMSNFVKNGSTFVKGLALGSVQFGAYIKSADLPELSPNLSAPKPPVRQNDNGETVQSCVSLSAGLPHFAVGYMRNWGRDTFIALRGLFILTGRHQEARYHILAYGACLRHGLIPNLLDGGRNPRFNCRDSLWWWLHCIKSYVEEAPNGINILQDKVSRIFPNDESPNQPAGACDQPLRDVIQEALNVHFQGLLFRERNAGRAIDEHMQDKGFNNQIGIHPESGFVFGGNVFNCGTWMDKMGSSDEAGNRGKPATPRDGSAIELIGLSKAVISWLDQLFEQKKYPYGKVVRTAKNGAQIEWTFKEWADRIQQNFEKYFWVNVAPCEGEIRPDLVNKRGIYKDLYGASQEWTDFQLRCNFPIAMVAAPELFNPQHAWTALKQAEKYLLGPLGMKTLDPEDWAYRGDYDNSNKSTDFNVSHGFNYHQGPEWVWPIGFYLRAKLLFAEKNGELKETIAETKVILSKHYTELQTSPWRGLPELTNSNGAYCRDSSRTQAWSMACVLEVLHDLQKLEAITQL